MTGTVIAFSSLVGVVLLVAFWVKTIADKVNFLEHKQMESLKRILKEQAYEIERLEYYQREGKPSGQKCKR